MDRPLVVTEGHWSIEGPFKLSFDFQNRDNPGRVYDTVAGAFFAPVHLQSIRFRGDFLGVE